MPGRLSLIRGNALTLPLADQSVALIVTSPPYFNLRSYRDGGEHFDGQLGSEPTPFLFLANLWRVMDEAWRVLRGDGNCWLNLGDKFAQDPASAGNLRQKTRMALPHRFYEGCIDPEYRAFTEQRAGLDRAETERRLTLTPEDGGYPQWVGRLDVVWSKANGMPSSAQDRCRDSHEYWFHLTKSERYFSALDEIREESEHRPGGMSWEERKARGDALRQGEQNSTFGRPGMATNPLGKPPGSVWEFPSEPLVGVLEFMVLDDPDSLHPTEYLKSAADAWAWIEERGVDCSAWPRSAGLGPQLYAMPDHFAAFGSQMVKRIILGWSPSGVCVACGDPRRPERGRSLDPGRRQTRRALELAADLTDEQIAALRDTGLAGEGYGAATQGGAESARRNILAAEARAALGAYAREFLMGRPGAITGYACSCPDTSAPTRPSVVLDPFSGTGTTAIVAAALGRHGIGVELSADYLRLARWRDEDGGLRCKALGVEKPAKQVRGQEALF